MKTLKALLILVVGIQMAPAQLIASDILGFDSDETIIETEYFANSRLEDPVFSSRKYERNIATQKYETTLQDLEWQGQLVVLKEIPYSYPGVSRRTIQLRTISELEEKEKSKPNQ